VISPKKLNLDLCERGLEFEHEFTSKFFFMTMVRFKYRLNYLLRQGLLFSLGNILKMSLKEDLTVVP